MMKRVLSLLLCLVMVLSFAAPTVQASSTDDIYVSDGSLDDVIVGEGVQLDGVVINGETVTTTTESAASELPNPSDLATVPQETSPVYAQQETTVPAEVEEQFPEGEATTTFEGATVNAKGIPEGGSVSVETAQVDTDAMAQTLVSEVDVDSVTELFAWDISVQNADGEDWQPTGTVAMELEMPGAKLHKYSKVYVVHVDDAGVATTIEASVTEDGKVAFETPGFSTFTGFTVDFAYNGEAFSIKGMSEILVSKVMDTLKMPLEIKDVADVAFTDETLVSVTPQEGDWLLTSLQAFTSTETLTITMKDGTVYEITVTDAITTKANFYVAYYEGSVYQYIDGNAVSGGNAEVQLFLDSDGYPQSGDAGVESSGCFDTQPLVIDGRDVGGCMEIILQKEDGAGDNLVWDLVELKIINGAKVVIRLGKTFTGTETITINSVQPYSGYAARPMFNIEDGSLYFNLGSDEASLCTGTGMLVTSTSSAKQIILDGNDLAASASVPLIYTHRGVDETDRQNLVVRGVTFRDAKHRAVLVQTNAMNNLYFSNCTFEKTVRDVSYGGGAIYIDGGTDGSTSNVVDVANFKLFNCTFSGNTGASGHGGAIASYGDIHTLHIDGCKFENCTSANRGGAIELSVNDKTASNHIFNWFKISNTSFTGCTARSHGGAIDISNGDDPVYLASNPYFYECTFTNCTVTVNRGGAIRMVLGPTKNSDGTTTPKNLKFENCGFSGCTAKTPGGAVSVQGSVAKIEILGSKTGSDGKAYTFKNCSSGDHGGAFIVDTSCGDVVVTNAVFTGNTSAARGAGLCLMTPTAGKLTISGSTFTGNTASTLGGGVFVGIRASATSPITVGAVSVSGSTFSNNRANGGVGGCLALTDGTYASISVSECSFSDSYSANYGGGIAIKTYADDATEKFPVKVTGAVQIHDCTFTNCTSGGLNPEGYDHDGDSTTANKTTWDHDGDPNTAEITRLNGTGGGAAITIGGEIGGGISIKGTKQQEVKDENGNTVIDEATGMAVTETVYSTFTNCYTWNNGGAICILGTVKTSKMDLAYLDINGCRARDAGGAVHLSNCIVDDLHMKNCTIRNCSYFDPDDANFSIDIPGTAYDTLGKDTYYSYDASGTFRCIGNTTCRALIELCTFTDNKSYSNGGGIYWNANNIRTGAGGSTVIPSLQVKWSVLKNNHAIRDGGGLYVEATVKVVGSVFEYNTADGRGGAIAQQVYSNEARTLGTGEATNLQLDANTAIRYNMANHGGGISITVSKTVSIADGTNLIYPVQFTLGGAQVYENKAITNGGGIYYATTQYPDDALAQREVDNFQKKININNGNIYKNIAGYSNEEEGITSNGGSGGGVYMDSNQINTAANIPEGQSTGYSQVEISSGSVNGNIAYSGNGGGIYLQGKNALCTITGGAVGFYYDDAGELTKYPNHAIPKETVTVSTDDAGKEVTTTTYSEGFGGGIAVFNGGRIEMTGGDVWYNEAYSGGGICLYNESTMQLSDGEIKYNIAGTRVEEEVTNEDGTTVTKVSYEFTSYQEGGGIAVYKNSQMDIYGGNVQENTAYCGGGIMVRTSSKLNMYPGTTTNEAGETVATAGMIQKNTATNGGGLGVRSGCTVNIEGGDIYDNTADAGGGIYILGNLSDAYGSYTTKVNVIGGAITENQAVGKGLYSGQGGGIHADRYCDITVAGNETTGEAGVISDNTAYRGGGVYIAAGACLTLKDGHLINNHATGTCTYTTTLNQNHGLRGVGGGVFAADGNDASHPSTFTLTGEDIAIYGNIADFAADDVFANGLNTKLDVKQVKQMNLAGYEFSPEAWFEDYCTNETNYTSGLNLAPSDSGITNGNVYRYRGAIASHRIRISEDNVTNKVNVANTFVCMTLGIPEAVNDTVVVDYGLPVKFNIMDNDVILNVGELAETGVISSVAPDVNNKEKVYEHNGIIYGAELCEQFKTGIGSDNKLTLPQGTASLDKTTGYVTYQINTTDLIMDTYDSFWYALYHKSAVQYENKPEGYYYYGNIQVIPATTIYFEDSFGTAIDYEGGWTDTSTPYDLTDLKYAQSQDRVGHSDDAELDANNVYGFDPIYDNMQSHSFGSAKKVTVSENNDASAVFTFTGTGFDIISHSSKKTGMVLVSVYDGTAVDDTKLITSYMVDTWYQGSSSLNLYQIPAIKVDLNTVKNPLDNDNLCGYGTYTVKVYVAWTWWADHEQNGYGSWDYYLDAIRIYNPAGDGIVTDATGKVIDTVVRDAYVSDNEGWPRYEEVRNLLISADTFSTITDTNIGGAIFIDGNKSQTESTGTSDAVTDTEDPLYGKKPGVVDYANFGPNNEVYLTAEQGIAFKLDTGAAQLPEGVEIASVQIGLRTSGGAGYVKVYDADTTTFANAESMKLNSSTDRYFDISDLDGGNVVIYCESCFNPVVITNVKITYTADPYGTGSGSVEGGSEGETSGAAQIFTVNAQSAQVALDSFVTETEAAPELTLKYPSLSFEGEICYNVYFDAQNLGSLTAADLGLAVFTTEDTEGTIETADDVIYGVESKDGLYMASTNGIPAKNMGDRMYFKVFAKLSDGSYVYSDMRSYNAVDYATDALANSQDMSLKALVVAMLNYGAQAQTFFGYNTDALMNAQISAEDQNLVNGFGIETLSALAAADTSKAGAFAATEGFTQKYPSVYFDGAFEINYNVIPGNTVDNVVTLYCWNEDTYASVDTLTTDNADLAVAMVNDNGTWKACSDQIAAKDLDKTVYAAAVYESEGTAYCTGILTYSIAAYCQEQAADTTSTMSSFAKATAVYGSAAKAFFG